MAWENHSVAFASAHGDIPHRIDPQIGQVLAVFRDDLIENRLLVTNEIHLIDNHDNFLNPQHPQHVTMAARIFLHAFLGIDNQNGCFSMRSAGDHVLDEFDVPGGINDDVIAFGRLKKHPG